MKRIIGLTLIIIVIFAGVSFAEEPWKINVGVLTFYEGVEDAEMKKDIIKNLKKISDVKVIKNAEIDGKDSHKIVWILHYARDIKANNEKTGAITASTIFLYYNTAFASSLLQIYNETDKKERAEHMVSVFNDSVLQEVRQMVAELKKNRPDVIRELTLEGK